MNNAKRKEGGGHFMKIYDQRVGLYKRRIKNRERENYKNKNKLLKEWINKEYETKINIIKNRVV